MDIELGAVVMTQGIAGAMSSYRFKNFVSSCIRRYVNLDWGDMCEADKNSNDIALKYGYRILASYKFPESIKAETGDDALWIITEADRSVTTLLFPSEY